MKNKEVKSEIQTIHCYLNEGKTKVLATVSWNDRPPKLDIRKCWEKDGDLMLGGGVSLDEGEVDILTDALTSLSKNGKLPSISKDGRKAVDFDDIFDSATDIVEKRDAGFTTEDGFIKLRKRPGVKLK